MGETDWTAEQLAAITEKGCSLLVAAAAGAGKTAVLVERIIRKITDPIHPVDIDQLLIVTFTNAAATEMRERIADAIAAALEKNPGSKNIQRQMTLLNKASITTIHSFCLEVIRANFQKIDIDPGFRIADETEASLIKIEVLDQLFEDIYEAEEEDLSFMALLESYGGNRDDRSLQEMVLSLFHFIQSTPWPEKWLAEMTGAFDPPKGLDFAETPWGKVLLESVHLELLGLREMLSRAVGMINKEPGLVKYGPVFAEDQGNLDHLFRVMTGETENPWDDIFSAFQKIEFSRLPNAAKDVDKEIQERVKKIRDDLKGSLKKMAESVFANPSQEIREDLLTLYPLMLRLAALVTDFSERYAKKKSKKSLVDFNDLEHFCLDILTDADPEGEIRPSPEAISYRQRFQEILVDEYQDSNLVQEMLVRMISRADGGEPNVFMVGDVKQSIYRFRQAKPELFLEKYRSFSLEPGNPFRKILLFKNYRSRKEVVDAVNFIFKQIMSLSVGELDYTDVEALYPGAVFPEAGEGNWLTGGETELHLMETGGQEPRPEEAQPEEEKSGEDAGAHEEEAAAHGEMLDRIQCEARLVANRIRELIGTDAGGRSFRVFDKNTKKYRQAAYRDMVILLRTTRNWSDVFWEELVNQGIPAFADTGSGFFKTSEVQVILSLLSIIDNPIQDIPLLSVLRSPIINFSTNELAELRLIRRKDSLFHALQELAAGDNETAKKAATFLSSLTRWREKAMYLSCDQLIWQLYNETGYYGTVGAMPAGEQRQANLRILFERARGFEETSFKGLFNFINFVDKLKSSRGDMGSAKILGENDNVVRIMSIHKSKGLEFPVVFLSGCGKKFNLQDMNKSILLHQELGFGPDLADPLRRISYPSVPKQAIREKIKGETLSEEMRILYVAMTRAREKLIITGTVMSIAKAIAKWNRIAGGAEGVLPPYEILKGGCFLDWMGPALCRHQGCTPLREGVEFHGQLLSDPSVWQIRFWNKGDILESQGAAGEVEDDFVSWLRGLTSAETAPEYAQEIAKRLGWKYPYEKIAVITAKVSVTEVKRRFEAELAAESPEETMGLPGKHPALVKRPLFLAEKKGLSAAEAGTAMHFVMQHLDLGRDDIGAEIREMADKDLLTPEQAKAVDVGRIRRFFASPLGQRMITAKRVYRELPFNLAIPCGEIYREIRDEVYRDETTILQGVIDCCFEEGEEMVLLDYKTDYVPEGGAGILRARYQLQIDYYARALETLTGKRVKEKYIYLFRNGEIIAY